MWNLNISDYDIIFLGKGDDKIPIIDQHLVMNLSESEKIVSDYIIEHKDQISNLSINKLAKYTYSYY